MLKISEITNDAVQNRTIILPDETEFDIQIRYVPQQLGWFIESLTYQDFSVSGIRIVNSYNLLYQYTDLIPFGIACFSSGHREPALQEDFASGSSELFLLTPSDKIELERFITDGE